MTLAKFTKDMTETLVAFFHAYESHGVVTLQVTERGLWLVNPLNDSRQFLGQAQLGEEEERARARRLAGATAKGMN